jgi:hypothetical protein
MSRIFRIGSLSVAILASSPIESKEAASTTADCRTPAPPPRSKAGHVARAQGAITIPKSVITIPKRVITMPKSLITIPKRVITMVRYPQPLSAHVATARSTPAAIRLA